MDSNRAPSTIGSYVTTALNAAQLKGVDVKTFYPELYRLLNRLSLRTRKLGNLTRIARKGTTLDTRDAFDVKTLHQGLQEIQAEKPDFKKNYRVLSAIVMVLVALAAGARISDLPLISIDGLSFNQDSATIVVPNVKTSVPMAKRLIKQKKIDLALPLLKKRAIKLVETGSKFSVVKYLRLFVHSFGRNRRFLFSAKPSSQRMISPITLRNRLDLFLHKLKKKTTSHVFRTTNVSLARAAGIPDSVIMSRCGWGEEGLLDRYQRTVDQPLSYNQNTSYEDILGI